VGVQRGHRQGDVRSDSLFDLLSLFFARALTPLTHSRSEQGEQAPPAAKSEKEISSEIAAIIRQACAQMLVPSMWASDARCLTAYSDHCQCDIPTSAG